MRELEAARVTNSFQRDGGEWRVRNNHRSPTARTREKVHASPEAPRGSIQAKPREEAHLFQCALSGDPEALHTLFTRHRGRLYRTAFSLLGNKEDAEDALQDGLLSAYLNLASFEGRSLFSTWLTRIVLNAARMNRRRLVARRQVSLQENDPDETEDVVSLAKDVRPDPERAYAALETKSLVEKEARELSPVLQSAFRLRDLHDFSGREAARAAGVKPSAMKSRTVRARRQLASRLVAEGVRLGACFWV
jgi:RNA polymerase sigma-70 factor (ECF subfamily)